jgi:surface polysaccharide O-acyltransferase-like enzyme
MSASHDSSAAAVSAALAAATASPANQTPNQPANQGDIEASAFGEQARMRAQTKTRITALDMSRTFACLFVILEHATTDPHGKPFPEADMLEKLLPIAGRVISNVARSEFFFVMSLFLLAVSLERFVGSYGEHVVKQAKRLLLPFLVWTLVYVFFRLYKAGAFGYEQAILDQIFLYGEIWKQRPETWLGLPGFLLSHPAALVPDPASWYKYLALGKSQYHMHFLPMLFLLTLFYPLYRLAITHPWLGLMVIPLLLFKNQMDVFLYSNFYQADARLFRDTALVVVKMLTYSGYGLAMFSIFGFVKRDVALLRPFVPLFSLALLLCVLAFAVHGWQIMTKGTWEPPRGLVYLPYYGICLVIVLTLLSVSHWPWPPVFSKLAPYSFGTYLVHPMMIDIFDVQTKGWQASVPVYSSAKIIFAWVTTIAAVYLLSRLPFWAWSMGLKRKRWNQL